MRKLFKSLLLVLVIVLVIGGCANKKSKEFKAEYEALNGVVNANGKEHRSITIPKDNPYYKVEASEIVKMIEDKETFYVYFGDELCPWCRSVIEKSIEVAKANKVKKIYYVKIWDKDGTEILRSKFKLNDNKEVEEVIKGTDDYYKLLEAFKDLLSDYTLTDADGNKVEVGEKRIYAPNYIYVENGVAKKLTEGISEKQTDSRAVLTDEMLKDEEDLFNKFFKKD